MIVVIIVVIVIIMIVVIMFLIRTLGHAFQDSSKDIYIYIYIYIFYGQYSTFCKGGCSGNRV